MNISKKISILFFMIISSCNNRYEVKSEKYIKNSKGEVYIVILETHNWKGETATFLTKNELKIINEILPLAVDQMNLELKENFKDFPDELPNLNVNLDEYKRQYFPYLINKTGEKEVFINCFCKVKDDFNWKEQKVEVLGGGKCYFQGFINLKTRKFSHFLINAPL
ncbi:hypothetical protein [Flavobacterium okayamense]|uniref:Lipoprotein n=1 Tax=Flavobacterium okayamense TaxID=2830782 RepID=A0ABM7S8Q9_9FLAO|nr:hypothetical protein [Flavobacterium okayamense]BCY29053.1 hypothetical protein KK2020170_19210 [Flavobacterium okayamense]